MLRRMEPEQSTQQQGAWTLQAVAIWSLTALLLILLGVSVVRRDYVEPLFIHTTYYFMLVTVACWAGSYLYLARTLDRSAIWSWIKENRNGIVVALIVTVVAGVAIHPALRVLSDEANLLGTSKNFFASKVATFTTTGKYYYDNFWDAGVVIDRRPSLFPFLVSLLHVVRGYSYTNVFLFNLILLPIFILVAYRVAKRLGGETFGVLAAMLVVAHPITLISVRSGGFDFMTALFALLIFHSFLDHCQDPTPSRQAVLWMNLCVFAEARYETALFVPPVVVILLVFRLLRWSHVKPFALIYALTPAYLLPRVWQAILRGNVPEQDPGTVTFSLTNFLQNTRDYFKPIINPFDFHPPHAAIVIALGIIGTVLWVRWMDRRVVAREWQLPRFRFGALVMVWMVLQMVIVFTYFWGRALHPASARLVISFDTFFAFPAAWAITVLLKRFRPFVSMIVGVAILSIYVPVASEYRFLNELTLTREAATTWRFFESLHEKRILIVCDRPGLYTIMNYGAIDFESAKQDATLLESLSRHLFYDIYLVQQIDLTNNAPLPQQNIWPDRPREPMLEFQNDANATIRISRLLH
jgi:hypothetical protein